MDHGQASWAFFRARAVLTGWMTKSSWKDAGVDVVVSLLTPGEDSELGLSNEQALVQQNGLTVIGFPIPDYSVPGSMKTTRQLVSELQDCLACGKNVGIHCRQGIGRSLSGCRLCPCNCGRAGKNITPAYKKRWLTAGSRHSEQRDWVAAFARSQLTNYQDLDEMLNFR